MNDQVVGKAADVLPWENEKCSDQRDLGDVVGLYNFLQMFELVYKNARNVHSFE